MDPEIRRRTLLQILGGTSSAIVLTDTTRGADGNQQSTRIRAMPDTHGPMRTGRFVVEFDDEEVAGWKTVTIPSVSIEEGTYREGPEECGHQTEENTEREDETGDGQGDSQERGLPGQTVFDDLEMERDMVDTSLVEWKRALLDGTRDDDTRTITVTLTDEEAPLDIQWRFFDARMRNYDPPELDASADGDVATESLTVAFDRMKREEV